ncbi:MAG: hypothetical protein IT285_02590 [Bdellovibrionales bacterium]|nr:hypothetical protein [Bdellovibrionales bacterium]
MATNRVHLSGFGSQGTAWAENLRDSGWEVLVYLPRRSEPSESWKRAESLGFSPRPLGELPAGLEPGALVAALIPDAEIPVLYKELLERVETPLTLVLAHGYAVYSGGLRYPREGHSLRLLAPKAIGPKLRQNFATGQGHHTLKAAVDFDASDSQGAPMAALAAGLGFRPENLILTTARMEAIGDLISEQSLLCGGVFNLLEWTMERMRSAGVPEPLVQEECITELELVASLVRELGPAGAFAKISSAAQAGTIEIRSRLIAAGVPELLEAQADEVLNGGFAERFENGEWRVEAQGLRRRLELPEVPKTKAELREAGI